MVDLVYLSIPAVAAPKGSSTPETNLRLWIEKNVGAKGNAPGSGDIASIGLPDLKIGTLDNLVIQGEEAAKLDAQLQGLVFKVHDVITQLVDSPQQVEQAEKIDSLSAAHYLRQFGWNTAKYRPDNSIGSLLDQFGQDAHNADQDLKARYSAYQNANTALAAADRKRGGDLTVRSLDSVLKKEHVIDSEYLQTMIVVVPDMLVKDFGTKYEQLSNMVVPRSAHQITAEKDHTLFTVVVFKKFASEFAQKAREAKWVIRDLDFNIEDEGAPTSEQDIAAAQKHVIKLKGDTSRLASAAFSDIIKAWGHVKIVRLFVESVLRYGLPPTFVTAAFEPSIAANKAESILIDQFGFLGGNAVTTDSKGKVKEDDLGEFGAVVEHDYKPFVIYTLELP